jgi:hypothetical protein
MPIFKGEHADTSSRAEIMGISLPGKSRDYWMKPQRKQDFKRRGWVM